MCLPYAKGYPHSSAGKESACNAGDPGSTPGSGRSAGEGIGYPLQYSWASLVAQPVKNPLAVRETWLQSLGWEDPLEKGKATHSSILAWRIPWISPWGHKESDTTVWLSLHHIQCAFLDPMQNMKRNRGSQTVQPPPPTGGVSHMY